MKTLNWKIELGVIVVLLAKDLLSLGNKLYVDNWYTSEALFNYLYENQTCDTGTTRKKNRMQLPQSLMNEKLKKGEFPLEEMKTC